MGSPADLAKTLGSVSIGEDRTAFVEPVPATACFLGLPREIRIEIYRYILAPTYNVLLCPKRASINDQNPSRIYPEILRTCSTCLEEGTVVLYSGHGDFRTRFLYIDDPLWLIEHWLPTIGQRNESLIRNLGMSNKSLLLCQPVLISVAQDGCLSNLERLTCKLLLNRADSDKENKAQVDLVEKMLWYDESFTKFIQLTTARPKLYFSFEDAGLSQTLLYLAFCTEEGLKGLDGYDVILDKLLDQKLDDQRRSWIPSPVEILW